MNRGEFLLRVLEKLAEAPQVLEDLLVIVTAPYGTSLKGMEYRLAQYHRQRDVLSISQAERQRFHDLYYRLRKQGLITEVSHDGERTITMHKRGRAKLELLRNAASYAFPRPVYEKIAGKDVKIIIFDIPERERRKRAWLRAVLKHIGFTMVQKSVWVGKYAIPSEFLEDLERMRLLAYVQILAVTRSGSLHPMA